MEKTRMPKGEKYWYIECGNEKLIIIDWAFDYRNAFNDADFERGNYYSSKDDAKKALNRLRKIVLDGADVIEMPSEEDAEFESNKLLGLSGHDGDERIEEAYLDGFADCLHWLKSKVK